MTLTGFVVGDRGLGPWGDTHPAWIMAHAEVGPYLVVGGSAIGQMHLARKLPRDDAFVIRSVGPWLAVGMADGVGAYPLSRYGATYVAESLTALLLRPFVSLTKEKSETISPPLSGSSAPSTSAEEVKRSIGSELLEWEQRLPEGREPLAFPVLPSQKLRQASSISWLLSPHASTLLAHQDQDLSMAPRSFQGGSSSSIPDQNMRKGQMRSESNDLDVIAVMRQAFQRSHLGLRQHADLLGVEVSDLSCTALALLLNVEAGYGVVGQVGDGAVLGLTAQGHIEKLVHAPETGDPQAVYTLGRKNFEKYVDVQPIKLSPENSLEAFYIMTDGVSVDILFSPHSEDLENWTQAINRNLHASASPAQAAAGMLNWLATYQVKGSWDDRTLVVITQRGRSIGYRQPATKQSESAHSTDNP